MIEVLSSGYFTTLQDAGRPGFRQFGVPLSGAMDKKAYDLALALLPFKGDRCVFECTLIGPTLKIHQPTRFVLTGGEMECWLDDTPLKMNRVYRAEIGKVLKIGKSTLGIRTYLRFEAHLAVESYLNSVAFYTPITPVQQIKDRDQISFLNVPLRIEENPVHLNVDESYLNATELNVMAGPDWPLLNLDQQNKLLTESHKIISQNRMGYRLSTALKIDAPNLSSDLDIVAQKSTALAAQNFMISMAANGYDTCPMEGFDSKRVKTILGLPQTAMINMVISCGIRGKGGIYGPQFRVPFKEVYFQK